MARDVAPTKAVIINVKRSAQKTAVKARTPVKHTKPLIFILIEYLNSKSRHINSNRI
jgi:hypothetical protein